MLLMKYFKNELSGIQNHILFAMAMGFLEMVVVKSLMTIYYPKCFVFQNGCFSFLARFLLLLPIYIPMFRLCYNVLT